MVKDLSIEVPSGFTFQLNEGGFVIKTVGNSLILTGNEDGEYRGTVYAVYTSLKENEYLFQIISRFHYYRTY